MTREGVPRPAVLRGPAPAGVDSALPGVLGEIAESAGRETAIALALAWGGRDDHIPQPAHLKRHPDHPLAVLLAAEGTAGLVAELLGGNKIYLPRARRDCAKHLASAGAGAGETVAVAVNDQGRREVLGMAIGASEAETFWTEFLRGLARRGLSGVKLVIADDHTLALPDAVEQRSAACTSAASPSSTSGIRSSASIHTCMWSCPTPASMSRAASERRATAPGSPPSGSSPTCSAAASSENSPAPMAQCRQGTVAPAMRRARRNPARLGRPLYRLAFGRAQHCGLTETTNSGDATSCNVTRTRSVGSPAE